MKPIMLHGHERAVTQIKYNREGDLLFSCAKDSTPNVWHSLNGERLGSLKGHGGAVWGIDVTWDSTQVITGSADNSCRIWDTETGKQLHELETKSAVRTCGWSFSGNLAMFSTDKAMSQECEICIYDVRDNYQMTNKEPYLLIPVPKAKVTAAVWGHLDDMLITGHESGDLIQWDVTCGDMLRVVGEHKKQINDIQMNANQTAIIAASKDCTAKMFDTATLDIIKTFKTERPVNSASMSPLKPHVVLGGGQEAMDVTTTSTRIGKFNARFFHSIFEEEFGSVKGHFGPINTVAFTPDGKGYSSGGEDGYVRIHEFDQQYFEFELDF